MADSDKELKIAVVTTADTGALSDFQKEFAGVEARLTGVYQGARDVRQAFGEFDRIMPGLGTGMMALATGPLGLLAAGADGIYLLTRGVGELSTEWEKMGEVAEKALQKAAVPDFLASIEHAREVIGDTAADWQAFLDGLDDAAAKMDTLNDKLETELRLIAAVASAQGKYDEARKAEALANLEAQAAAGTITPQQEAEGREAIEKHYLEQKQAEADQAQNEEITAKQVALHKASESQASLNATYQAADAQRRKDQAHIEEVKIDPVKQQEAIMALRTKISQMEELADDPYKAYREAPAGVMGTLAKTLNIGSMDYAGQAQAIKDTGMIPRAQAQLNMLEQQFAQFQATQTPESRAKNQADVDAANNAKKAADDNAALVAKLTAEIANLQQTIAQTRPLEHQTTAAQEATISAQQIAGDLGRAAVDLKKASAGSANLPQVLADLTEILKDLAANQAPAAVIAKLQQQVAALQATGNK